MGVAAKSLADQGGGQVIELSALVMSYVIAPAWEYDDTVLNQAQASSAEVTIGLGRRLLQRIAGTGKADESLPEPLADVATDPGRGVDRGTAARDPQGTTVGARLRAEVEGILISAGVSVTASGERSIAAQRITGIAGASDNITVSQ